MAPTPETRKTITVVFSDLVGSTPLAERLDPETLRVVMVRYFETMRRVLERHGGSVEKFIGDAVVAVFGLPRVHEDDALRAVRAAADIQAALGALNRELERDHGVELENRTGVNTGEVVAGDLSTRQRLVSGDAMNVAARLQQVAAPGSTVIGESTYRLVRHAVTAEPLAALTLKGKTEAVSAYRLMAVSPVTQGSPTPAYAPLVGREDGLASLQQALQAAIRTRSSQLVTVVGAAGLGKSRLVEEFLRIVEDGTSQLRSRCLPYGEGITFWPLAEIVKQAARIGDGDGLAAAKPKLMAVFNHDGGALADRLAAVIGLSDSAYPVEETFWATGQLLQRFASQEPLVVTFDDIHWGEATFLNLIEHVTDLHLGRPILLIVATRPDLLERRPKWAAGRPNATRINLEPLSDLQGQTLLRSLLGTETLPAEVAERISRAGEGNPLFIEQLLFMWKEDGSASLEVPATLSALLGARLDRLAARERTVIECAAVLGPVFDRDAVADLCPPDMAGKIGVALRSLVRQEFIRSHDASPDKQAAFRFRHILIRDAAYTGTLKRVRAALHERCAAWLEREAQEQPGEEDELVAFHLEQAYRYRTELAPADRAVLDLGRRAADRLGSAGKKAWERGDASAAANLLGRAVSVLEASDPARLEIVPTLGAALRESGDRNAAEAVLGEGLMAARALHDRRVEWRTKYELLELRVEPWNDEVVSQVEQLIPELEQLGDELGVAKCWRFLTMVHWMRGNAGAAEQACRRAAEHARQAGDHREEIEILAGLALNAVIGPTAVPDGINRCREILRTVEGNRRGEGFVLQNLALLEAMGGCCGDARASVDRAQAILAQGGVRRWLGVEAQIRSFIAEADGEFQTAELELRKGIEIARDKDEFAWLAAYFAQILCKNARHEEALAYTVLGEQSRVIDIEVQVLLRSVRAKVLAARGSSNDAESLAREAVGIAARTDNIVLHADALMDLAHVLGMFGRPAEAKEATAAALQLYEQKGFVPMANRARGQLARLLSPPPLHDH